MLLISLWALIIAVVAYVYREILAYEDVLNWWFRFGLRFEKRWFYKPVWGCQLCFSGQVALWIYFLNWLSTNFNTNAPFWRLVFFFIPKYDIETFNVFLSVFSVSLTILLTFLLTKTIKKLEK